jgi:hypothetical protein
LATASTIVAGVAVGCGGSSGGNPTDSGAADVTTDHVAEAAMEAAPEAAAEAGPDVCTSDAMITGFPMFDGSIPGSDASASACLGCLQSACPMIISECNAICGCPDAFLAFEACIQGGGSALTCGETDLLGAGLPVTDLACAAACTNQCGVMLPMEGGAEGGNDGGDASTDATGQ